MKRTYRHFILVFGLTLSFGLWAQQTEGKPRVRLVTSMGEIVIELEQRRAPETVNNFLTYLQMGWYDGTIFHRVIKGEIIQGGGFRSSFEAIPRRTSIRNESKNGLSNLKGTIAMARTADPHSATNQFYINLNDNTSLDFGGGADRSGWGYAVFGRVVEGLEVAEKIGAVATGPKGPFTEDVPRSNVVLEKVELVRETQAQ